MAPQTRSGSKDSQLKNRLRSSTKSNTTPATPTKVQKTTKSTPAKKTPARPTSVRNTPAKTTSAKTTTSKGLGRLVALEIPVRQMASTKANTAIAQPTPADLEAPDTGKETVRSERCYIAALPNEILTKILTLVASSNESRHPVIFHALTRSCPLFWNLYKAKQSHFDRLALVIEPYAGGRRAKKPHNCYRYCGEFIRTIQAVDIIERHKGGEHIAKEDIIIHKRIEEVPLIQLTRLCKLLHDNFTIADSLPDRRSLFGGSLFGATPNQWSNVNFWRITKHYFFRGAHEEEDIAFVEDVTDALGEDGWGH